MKRRRAIAFCLAQQLLLESCVGALVLRRINIATAGQADDDTATEAVVCLMITTAIISQVKIMSRTLADISEQALKLPQNEQLKLARTLLESSEATGDVDVEAAWEQEIERRIQIIDAGLAKGRPFADVVRDIDRQLDR